ncbi:MAG: hypothetical protein ABR881_32210 [Candidatus Sulfotelmatobacter sp.]|jgi:hypothetical protein
MSYKVKLPLYLSWSALKKQLGWPYSRTQTGRLMFDPAYVHNAFPACRKLGPYRNSHPIWFTPEVLDYFKRHGLAVPENIEFDGSGED